MRLMQAIKPLGALFTADAVIVATGMPSLIKVFARALKAMGLPVWICDGTNDYVEVAAAVAALPASGGKIVMVGPVFTWGGTTVDINGSADGQAYKSIEIHCPGQINVGSAISMLRFGNTLQCDWFKGRFGNVKYTGTARATGAKAFEVIRGVFFDVEYKLIELFEYGVHVNVKSGVDANGRGAGAHNRFYGMIRNCKYDVYIDGDGVEAANNAEMNVIDGPWLLQTDESGDATLITCLHIEANAPNTKVLVEEIDTFNAGSHAIVDNSGYNEIRTTSLKDMGGVGDAERLGIDAVEGTGKSTDTIHVTLQQNNYVPKLNLTVGPITFPDGSTMNAAADYGLSFEATVTEVVSGTAFKASGMAGKGDAYFGVDYYAVVIWDAAGAGATPQGEKRPISAYVSSTGQFTHTAFSSGLAVGDKLLIMHSSLIEKTSTISYTPTIKDTGDLEAATKTITATAEAVGTGNADYSSAQTLTIPTDSRLTISEIAARLQVTIDSFDTATHLYCRCYVDAQDADHKLFDTDWDSTGAKIASQVLNASTKAVIFNLLKDGSAHTFYFFFWVNVAGNAVISQGQIEYGVGHTGDSSWTKVMGLDHDGLISVNIAPDRKGSGADYLALVAFGAGTGAIIDNQIAASGTVKQGCVVVSDPGLVAYTNTATDIVCVSGLAMVLLNQH